MAVRIIRQAINCTLKLRCMVLVWLPSGPRLATSATLSTHGCLPSIQPGSAGSDRPQQHISPAALIPLQETEPRKRPKASEPLQGPNVLINVFDEACGWDDGLAGIQHLHTDQQPGSPGYVMLAALDNTATLVVCLKSHKAVASWFESTDEHSKHAAAQEAQFLALCEEYTPVRIKLEPGYVYVMDANLVHAGDAGKPGQYSPRLHYYMITDELANETFILNSQGGEFAAKFGAPDFHPASQQEQQPQPQESF